ncbi:adenine nucleotide alpha-hydrolase family protein [Arboricoccus pini]|nr:adenine nucleotide alpha hydrolase [Arboricoccus pini]
MTHELADAQLRLEAALRREGPLAIAVSGGVDSMTLAYLAHRVDPKATLMVHAVSAAVPGEATRRVEVYAARWGWTLRLIDAGEFADPDYLRNPVNRCFFCKRNLYGAIAAVARRRIMAGTNLDDLGDYRPGLEAASQHDVRHPYVEAGIDKKGVRALATAHGLDDLAELPAAPCLASRLETGIAVTPLSLRLIEAIETRLKRNHPGHTLRARLRAGGLVVELDHRLDPMAIENALGQEIADMARGFDERRPIRYERYRMGSAFVGRKDGVA